MSPPVPKTPLRLAPPKDEHSAREVALTIWRHGHSQGMRRGLVHGIVVGLGFGFTLLGLFLMGIRWLALR